MTSSPHPFAPRSPRPPGWIRLALEARAPMEFAGGLAAWPMLRTAPRGDGHPVLVFPGLAATDFSTRPLRRLLARLGHEPYGWGQGRNLGPRPEVLEAALIRIRSLAERHGRRVSLVGWSLGGLYARELAKQAPEVVRAVVSLGSPFAGSPRATNAWRLYAALNREAPPASLPEGMDIAPPVPTTSIWSRSDGIVAWQCCVERPGPMSENIVVEASHTGLGVHPLVLHALADRLAQPEGAWRPFDRRGLRRFLYPDPERATRSMFEPLGAHGAAR